MVASRAWYPWRLVRSRVIHIEDPPIADKAGGVHLCLACLSCGLPRRSAAAPSPPSSLASTWQRDAQPQGGHNPHLGRIPRNSRPSQKGP